MQLKDLCSGAVITFGDVEGTLIASIQFMVSYGTMVYHALTVVEGGISALASVPYWLSILGAFKSKEGLAQLRFYLCHGFAIEGGLKDETAGERGGLQRPELVDVLEVCPIVPGKGKRDGVVGGDAGDVCRVHDVVQEHSPGEARVEIVELDVVELGPVRAAARAHADPQQALPQRVAVDPRHRGVELPLVEERAVVRRALRRARRPLLLHRAVRRAVHRRQMLQREHQHKRGRSRKPHHPPPSPPARLRGRFHHHLSWQPSSGLRSLCSAAETT